MTHNNIDKIKNIQKRKIRKRVIYIKNAITEEAFFFRASSDIPPNISNSS